MVKLKATKMFGLEIGFDAYVIDFVREAGQTKAIIINEGNKIETIDAEDLDINFHEAIYR